MDLVVVDSDSAVEEVVSDSAVVVVDSDLVVEEVDSDWEDQQPAAVATVRSAAVREEEDLVLRLTRQEVVAVRETEAEVTEVETSVAENLEL